MTDNSTVSAKKLTEGDLQQFTGTTHYYLHRLPFVSYLFLTEGSYFLREHAQCHWLFNDIGSHLFANKILAPYRKQPIGLFWKLSLSKDTAEVVLTCSYDEGQVLVTQTYGYSDIRDFVEMTEIEIWTFPTPRQNRHINWVALLPSEH